MDTLKKIILVIDDERTSRKLLFYALGSLGVEVMEADSGDQGRTFYSEHLARTALVICDMNLPGETGFDIFDSLKRINPSVKVLFISGMDDATVKDKLLGMGAVGVLAKPVPIPVLTQTIKQLLAS
jgi:putative two-component system response regulator